MKETTDAKTLLRAIRAYCLECSGNSRKEVERCGFGACALYPYRLPDRPEQRRTISSAKQIDFLKGAMV